MDTILREAVGDILGWSNRVNSAGKRELREAAKKYRFDWHYHDGEAIRLLEPEARRRFLLRVQAIRSMPRYLCIGC